MARRDSATGRIPFVNSAGHPFGHGPTATISESCERADTWRDLFGGLTVPIKTAVPRHLVLPIGVELCYDIDMARLDDATIDRLAQYAQQTFVQEREIGEVRKDITERFGFPIIASDVSTVTTEHPEDIVHRLEEQIERLRAHVRVRDPILDKLSESHHAIQIDAVRTMQDQRFVLTVDGAPPDPKIAEMIGQHIGSHAFAPVVITEPSTPEQVRTDVLRIRDEGLRAVDEAFDRPSTDEQCTHHAALDAVFDDISKRMDAQAGVETFDIPEGASIGDVKIPSGSMTAAQIATMIGGEVIGPSTIRGPSLHPQSTYGTIEFSRKTLGARRGVSESDMLSADQVNEMRRVLVGESRILSMNTSRALSGEILEELDIISDSDGLPPALCHCLTDGTPRGPHCVHAREWVFVDNNGVRRIRKHGGAHTCPRACVECPDGAHHFCEVDMQPVFDLEHDLEDDDADDLEEKALLRKHPAYLAGCEQWYECRHCDAWLEDDIDDDMGDEDEDEEDDEPDSDDFEEDDEDDEDDWDDDEPDSGPPPGPSVFRANDVQLEFFRTPASVVSALAEHPTNDGRLVYPDVIDAGLAVYPQDILSLAESAILTCRFIGLLTPAQAADRTLFAHWSGVAAQWPADVRADVLAWTERTAPNGDELDVPDAVRALVEQANASGGEV